jgi:glucose dehydrogenase
VTLFRGQVLVGTSGSGHGRVCCLNASNGRLRWSFYTVPNVDGGGGGVWTSPAIDEEHGIVYCGTGEAKSFVRPGQVLFSESLLANDVDTGEMHWYFQARAADIYRNFDFSCHPMVFDAQHPWRSGVVRKCVGAGSKAGFYTVDRLTGDLYWKAMLTPASPGGGPQLNSTAVAYNRVFVVSNAQSAGQPATSVTAGLNAYTGDIEWWVHNAASNSAPVAVANKVFFQGLRDGGVHALDADSGARLWEYKLPSGHLGGIAIANGSVYTSNGGPFRPQQTPRYSMFCFRPDGGQS